MSSETSRQEVLARIKEELDAAKKENPELFVPGSAEATVDLVRRVEPQLDATRRLRLDSLARGSSPEVRTLPAKDHDATPGFTKEAWSRVLAQVVRDSASRLKANKAWRQKSR